MISIFGSLLLNPLYCKIVQRLILIILGFRKERDDQEVSDSVSRYATNAVNQQ